MKTQTNKYTSPNFFLMKTKASIILLFVLLCSANIFAQVRVPFTQRTSAFSPGKTIYNVKGDFVSSPKNSTV